MKTLFLSLFLLTSVGALAAPARIVSTTGNASEIIATLGKADSLVAVDTTSILPIEVMKDKPKIGYRRQLSAEGILSMNPDLVILAPDSGPPAVIEQIEGAGVSLFRIEDKQTLEGIAEDTARIGELLDAPEATAAELQAQKEAADKLHKTLATYPHPPKLLILIDPGQGQLFGLGEDSAGGHLASILGASLSQNFQGRRPLSAEVLATDPADAVLIAARLNVNDPTPVKTYELDQSSPLSIHTAAEKNCIFAVNIVKALGFGPKTAKDANAIAEAITHCMQE